MDPLREVEIEQEPMGIIISGGNRTEETPRFSAYVWGPVPTEETKPAGAMVAA